MTAAATATRTTMTAAVRDTFGSPDVVTIREIARPELEDDRVLVRVHAASVNRADWYNLTGPPMARPMMGLRRPRSPLLGTDFAGTVEAVGKDVTGVEPGDEVFGGRDGAFAEYVCARSFARKPANVTFEEAACMGVAGLTALQGLRYKAQLEPGQTVLVNGASGGVGTFAVQVAKALGAATVTAVCSTRNVELARSIGADEVVDYTREDFTRRDERYDVLYDLAGSRSWRECARVLTPDGTLVLAGGKMGGLLGPLPHIGATKLASLPGRRRAVFYIAKFNSTDLAVLADLLETGKVKPVVERRYALGETADALRYLGEGHAQGKVVVTV
jgi:NADPH:quinone reductase-like Zn-dependent oxidoreductase